MVAFDLVKGVEVCTSFLGMDFQHNPKRPPLLFETMVFGGPLDGTGRRYTTWDEAIAGHAETVAAVRTEFLGQRSEPCA